MANRLRTLQRKSYRNCRILYQYVWLPNPRLLTIAVEHLAWWCRWNRTTEREPNLSTPTTKNLKLNTSAEVIGFVRYIYHHFVTSFFSLLFVVIFSTLALPLAHNLKECMRKQIAYLKLSYTLSFRINRESR